MNPNANTVVQASAIRISQLFHQGRFTVPWHQRYYDWERRDVSSLLQDIDLAIQADSDCYFLGTIMLVGTDKNTWEINDGQQRMVTVSLICATLCRRFNEEAPGSQREGIALRLLFDRDSTSISSLDDAQEYTPRIVPPRNDATSYSQMIAGHTIGTNGNLTTACSMINQFFLERELEELKQYFDFLTQKVEVVCLRVPAHVDSNAVYEAINCRGKTLGDLDLIRNYLYSHFNLPKDSKRKTALHEGLENIRIVFSANTRAFEYLRCFFQCRIGFLPKENFYKDARQFFEKRRRQVQSRDDCLQDYVFSFARSLASKENLELFRRIKMPSANDEFVADFLRDSRTTNSPRNLSVFLLELNNYSVTLPLIFSILRHYVKETSPAGRRSTALAAHRSLSRLAAFVLRTAFVAVKFEPSHFEKSFSDFSMRIMGSDEIPVKEFRDFLVYCDGTEERVLDNKTFEKRLRDAQLRGATRIKQFLLGINRLRQVEADVIQAHQCSVEHILPTSSEHWSSWHEFRDADPSAWVHRIGNLTLMGRKGNKPGLKYNRNFEAKRQSYRSSVFQLTRDLAEYDAWKPSSVEYRQRLMAKEAAKVWEFR